MVSLSSSHTTWCSVFLIAAVFFVLPGKNLYFSVLPFLKWIKTVVNFVVVSVGC